MVALVGPGSISTIVSGQNSARCDDALQGIDDDRRQFFHALGQRLDDKVIAVTIDDQRWEKIRFSVNEPERGRVDLKRRSKPDRRFEATPDQGAIGRRLTVGQHPDCDLRPLAVERLTENLSATIANGDDVPRVGVNLGQVGAVDPWMEAVNAIFSSR